MAGNMFKCTKNQSNKIWREVLTQKTVTLRKALPTHFAIPVVVSCILKAIWEAQWRLVFDSVPFLSDFVFSACRRSLDAFHAELDLWI